MEEALRLRAPVAEVRPPPPSIPQPSLLRGCAQPAFALAGMAQQEVHLPSSVAPLPDAPVVFTTDQAEELRQRLRDEGAKHRRNVCNFALKWIRKACTDGDGRPVTISVDFTAKEQWLVPEFVYAERRPGVKGGQEGDIDFDLLRELDWRKVAAQLPPDAFHALFGPRSGGAEAGVVKVSFDVVGEEGHWWTPGHAANFDLVFWGTDCRVQVHPHKDAGWAGC